MCEIGEYIERLEGKIERQREQLSRLRAKKNRCLLDRADTYRRAIQRQKELELLCLSMKSDIKSLSEDNERLRAEIVRLSGGERSSAMVTWNQNTKPEKPPCCAVCLNSQRGYFGKSYCYAGKYSREIINPFSGTPEWCPL